jgi:hypothetical protein
MTTGLMAFAIGALFVFVGSVVAVLRERAREIEARQPLDWETRQ